MQIVEGFDPLHRAEVARLFWSAFSGKLSKLLGPSARGEAFVAQVLEPRFSLCALEGSEVLGVAGFKTPQGGLVGGTFSDLAVVYGWFGALWRGILLDQLERNLADGQLMMDGIFVAETARGQGVGTALLHAILRHAREAGYREVRLDVIDRNPRAKALYERNGFEPVGRVKTGLLRYVFGFSEATTMVYSL